MFSSGDNSGDGHCQTQDFFIESNKSVEHVRNVHFKILEKTGININNIANDYEDNVIKNDEFNLLKELGLNQRIGKWDDENEEENGLCVNPEVMCNIWIFLLMKTDPKLKMKIIPLKTVCGFDKKDRYISNIGYGCFFS
jgi:hypothetical protein